MGGDFTGVGTGAAYGEMLVALASAVFAGVERGMVEVRAFLKHRMGVKIGDNGGALRAEVLAALLAAVGAGRLKPSTAGKYGNVLAHFVGSLDEDDLEAVTPKAVAAFLSACVLDGVGSGSQRVNLSALRTVMDRMLGFETTRSMRYPLPPEPVQGASRQQVETLLVAASDDDERLLVLLLNVLKLRPGQIAALEVNSYCASDRALVVLHDKPEKSFAVLLPDEVDAVVVRVLRSRGRGRWIFGPKRGLDRPVSVRALQKRLARLCARCGLSLSCTALRNAESLVSVSEGGGDEPTVARAAARRQPLPRAFPVAVCFAACLNTRKHRPPG